MAECPECAKKDRDIRHLTAALVELIPLLKPEQQKILTDALAKRAAELGLDDG